MLRLMYRTSFQHNQATMLVDYATFNIPTQFNKFSAPHAPFSFLNSITGVTLSHWFANMEYSSTRELSGNYLDP